MAPRNLAKSTPKPQRTIAKTSTMKVPSLPSYTAATKTSVKKPSLPKDGASTETSILKKPHITASTIRKTVPVEKTMDTPAKERRLRTNTVPTVATPKPKDNRSVPLPSSVRKSVKKSWQRRPKPAHSGVPVPEKMRLISKQLQDCK